MLQVVPMSEQVEQFRKVRVSLQNKISVWGAHKLISNSIFLMLTGSNDLVTYLFDSQLRNQTNATDFLAHVVAAYRTTLFVRARNPTCFSFPFPLKFSI